MPLGEAGGSQLRTRVESSGDEDIISTTGEETVKLFVLAIGTYAL